MIGNIQRFRDAPTLDDDIPREDPVSMQTDSSATPCCCSGREGGLVTSRLHITSCLFAFLVGQSIEVAKNDCRQRTYCCLLNNHFELSQLSICRCMRIDMSVKDAKLLFADRNSSCHGKSRTPGTLQPRQVDSRYIR